MNDVAPADGPSLFPDYQTSPPVAEGKGRIRPRARLLRTIGAELISNEVVAVIELVRNCYDADATEVRIVFDRPETPDFASLEIRDDGHGMTREVLLGPWLEPATDHKSASGKGGTAGERSPGGRRRLGSKGVGRFAAQRLGRHLQLRTRAIASQTELTANFDWTKLEQDKYLDEVRIPWREGAVRHIKEYGTHLRIQQLRDRWSPERFEKLKLGLSRLVSPTMRQDFRILVVINGAEELIKPAIDASTAMYSIRGEVERGGRCVIHYQDINGTAEDWERFVLWPEDAAQTCGPFRFRINAWDLDSEPLKLYLAKTGNKLGLRDFRRVIRDHSGISLYRDGFRILPYGEPDNDWLRLDRRRVNNPTMRMSNNQVLGAIQLSADTNPDLKDQTNREGLVTNEAYGHLVEVVTELLGYLEARRFNARRAMDIDWQRRTSTLPDVNDDAQANRIDSLITRLAREGGARKAPDDHARHAEQLQLEFQQFRERTADAVRHYAGLASVGQMASLVFRGFEHPMRKMKTELGEASADLAGGGLSADDLADIKESVDDVLQALKTMEKQIQAMDPLAIGGRGRRVSKQQVNDIIMRVIEPFQGEFERLNVALDVRGDADVEVTTNREIAQQVLANLLENALWAASETEEAHGIVVVTVTKSGFVVYDNGQGIAETDKDLIFEPHFTRREGAHGLGLTLVKDLLKTIGGRVRLTKCKPATFRVELER